LKRVLQGEPSFDINISKLRVTTPNGGVMQFKSAENPDNLYGDDVFGIVADEATRMKEDAFYAMRSTITKTRGKIKIIGNSKGKKNWVYKLGMRARSGEQNYKYFKITAWDAVEAGILEREEVEQAQRDLPENVFKELYLAEPQEDGSNPFGFDYIRKCVRPLSTAKAEYFGIDLAKSRDWTVIIGLDGNGNIAYFDRFQKDWEQTTNEVIRVVGQTGQ
jgi:phage FluMu gp28-like protein